jgi:hypothetical protein
MVFAHNFLLYDKSVLRRKQRMIHWFFQESKVMVYDSRKGLRSAPEDGETIGT